MSENQSEPKSLPTGARRRVGMFVVLTVVLVGAIAYGVWWKLVGSLYVSTDNAYVQGNVVQVTAQAPGTVLSVHADDTDRVVTGQVLVRLDAADAQVALEQAEAQLGQTVREVRVLYANDAALHAAVVAREAEVARARSELARATGDQSRREGLVTSGAVSAEELQHARDAISTARGTLAVTEAAAAAAREQLAANAALTAGTGVAQHPNVLRAAARVRETWIALQRTTLQAPIGGHVARRNAQVGQRVQAGQALMSVVPLEQVWVDANFREVELRDMRIGQPVSLTADVFGNRVRYDGRIVGLAAGTGSTFALLPAQNATGNWIKVIQRVPVRIALDPKQVAEHPLRVGLSMHARVDIRDTGGPSLAAEPRTTEVASTKVFDAQAEGAQARIDRIVAANLAPATRKSGQAAPAARSARSR